MNDLPDDMPSDAERKMQFLYALRSKGVTDKNVLSAMEAVDRGPFIHLQINTSRWSLSEEHPPAN